ncbi:hypothetical protein DPMN_141860 [Dreissena polymorpha]|uniref:Uncharacterized protein n=1 Tax=Dreissena polymorpha TaxID=45954 RepID=A0A9D4GD56_DREPO|nr:hypothetical protein DPMN_141860 [Dreissena polymorpha]
MLIPVKNLCVEVAEDAPRTETGITHRMGYFPVAFFTNNYHQDMELVMATSTFAPHTPRSEYFSIAVLINSYHQDILLSVVTSPYLSFLTPGTTSFSCRQNKI